MLLTGGCRQLGGHRHASSVWLLLSWPGWAVLAAGCTSARGAGEARPWPACPGTRPRRRLRPSPPQQGDQNILSFTRCMRSHGVQLSDPVHHPGHAGLSIDMPSRSPANNAAYAACIHFIQANITAKQAGAAAQAAPQSGRADQVRPVHAEPRHQHAGPDAVRRPQPGHVPGITSDFGRYSPQFRAADAACRHFLPAGGQGRRDRAVRARRRQGVLAASLAAAAVSGAVATVAVRGGRPPRPPRRRRGLATATVVRTNLVSTALTGGDASATRRRGLCSTW